MPAGGGDEQSPGIPLPRCLLNSLFKEVCFRFFATNAEKFSRFSAAPSPWQRAPPPPRSLQDHAQQRLTLWLAPLNHHFHPATVPPLRAASRYARPTPCGSIRQPALAVCVPYSPGRPLERLAQTGALRMMNWRPRDGMLRQLKPVCPVLNCRGQTRPYCSPLVHEFVSQNSRSLHPRPRAV
jgi:hypothetical protein